MTQSGRSGRGSDGSDDDGRSGPASPPGARQRPAKPVRRLDRVIIRFAGDSGDGMQLTGDRFTSETASFGNDLSTLPDFPAEIRAPAGTLPGVSSFQLHFADHDILTPGRRAQRAGGDEPRRPEANLADTAARCRDHRQHRRVHQAGAGQGRLRGRTR
ncbi:hypothetical protein GCM10020229_19130 [Kitasatospora albolonga]